MCALLGGELIHPNWPKTIESTNSLFWTTRGPFPGHVSKKVMLLMFCTFPLEGDQPRTGSDGKHIGEPSEKVRNLIFSIFGWIQPFYTVNRKVYGIFPVWQFAYKNCHNISYSYQLNLVELPTKIFGLQGEARQKIKQETKVIDNLISLNSLHCQINLSKLQYI